MNAQERGTAAAVPLHFPGLAAVLGAQHGAEFTCRPAALLVEEENAIERQRLAGRAHIPGPAAVGTVQDDRAGPTRDPDMIAAAMDCLEIEAGDDIGGHLEVCEAP